MNMKKKIITTVAALATMTVGTAFAQDRSTMVAGVPVVELNNGSLMPRFGLGTYLQPSDDVCEQSCLAALKAGYRHIDTAHAYNDERGVGRAVKESGVPREEIWITSKIWPTEYGEGKTLEAIDKMLERLQTDHIDLLYLHQPVGDYVGAWKDMEKAVSQGKVRALGISNFDTDSVAFDRLMKEARIKPAVIQMECHPYAQRVEMRETARRNNIQVECWFPLGGAMSDGMLLKDPVITSIAQAHGKSAAQVILRWHIQEGFSVIPGSKNPKHIQENINIFDFELTDDEMARIRGLNKEERVFRLSKEDAEKFFLSVKMKD